MWAWVPWLCFNWDHFLDIIIFCLKDSRLVLNENTPFVSSSFIVQDEAYSNNDHESSVIRKPQLKISVPRPLPELQRIGYLKSVLVSRASMG